MTKSSTIIRRFPFELVDTISLDRNYREVINLSLYAILPGLYLNILQTEKNIAISGCFKVWDPLYLISETLNYYLKQKQKENRCFENLKLSWPLNSVSLSGRRVSRNSAQRCKNRIPLHSSVRRGDRECRPVHGVRATGERCSSSRVGTALGTCLVGSINFQVYQERKRSAGKGNVASWT